MLFRSHVVVDPHPIQLAGGALEIDVTIDDPKAYTKPFTIDMNMKIMIDTQMIEEFCLENEKDSSRLFGPGGAK